LSIHNKPAFGHQALARLSVVGQRVPGGIWHINQYACLVQQHYCVVQNFATGLLGNGTSQWLDLE
jgi:hypothetical protein